MAWLKIIDALQSKKVSYPDYIPGAFLAIAGIYMARFSCPRRNLNTCGSKQIGTQDPSVYGHHSMYCATATIYNLNAAMNYIWEVEEIE